MFTYHQVVFPRVLVYETSRPLPLVSQGQISQRCELSARVACFVIAVPGSLLWGRRTTLSCVCSPEAYAAYSCVFLYCPQLQNWLIPQAGTDVLSSDIVQSCLHARQDTCWWGIRLDACNILSELLYMDGEVGG